MESRFKKQTGQLIIELSLVLSFLTLVLFLSLRGAILIKKQFKHDFVSPSKIPEFEINFNKNIFLTKFKTLEKEGWRVEARTGIKRGWVFMKKDNQKLLLADKLGILL